MKNIMYITKLEALDPLHPTQKSKFALFFYHFISFIVRRREIFLQEVFTTLNRESMQKNLAIFLQ